MADVEGVIDAITNARDALDTLTSAAAQVSLPLNTYSSRTNEAVVFSGDFWTGSTGEVETAIDKARQEAEALQNEVADLEAKVADLERKLEAAEDEVADLKNGMRGDG